MSFFQELNVSIVPQSPKFSSANPEVEEEEEQTTELSSADVPKYRLFANNSLLVSSLDADDIRAYKCHVRYHHLYNWFQNPISASSGPK